VGQVLSGLSVVEFGEGIPLGYCGKLLADLGADVVKVEPPEGDGTRRYGPFPRGGDGPDVSALHLHLNTNKRSVALDVDNGADRERLGRLMAAADLVIESTAPGTLDGWGIGTAHTPATRRPRSWPSPWAAPCTPRAPPIASR
jgi:CoA:oxalate CoA-transferase